MLYSLLPVQRIHLMDYPHWSQTMNLWFLWGFLLKVNVDSHMLPSHLFSLNKMRQRQNGRYCADNIFKCIFLNENVWIVIKISLKLIPKGPINNIPALVQIMAWRQPGDKPLSEPMMVSLLTHICITLSQWVEKALDNTDCWINMGFGKYNMPVNNRVIH